MVLTHKFAHHEFTMHMNYTVLFQSVLTPFMFHQTASLVVDMLPKFKLFIT